MRTLKFESRFGDVSIRMRDDLAPKTCNYFAQLIANKALATASVFRIVTSTGLQSDEGCSINVIQIGPVEKFSGPRHAMQHEDTRQTGLVHRKWTVSAARFDLGELYASFFICLEDEPELDHGGSRQPDGQGFAAFGEVVQGFDTLEKIFSEAQTTEMLTEQIPIKNVRITST